MKIIQKLLAIVSLSHATLAFANHDCDILLHGLGRSHYVMGKIGRALIKHGDYVVNESYPSTSESIEDIAEQSFPRLIKTCQTFKPDHINIVTHSMGGIVLREYLQHHHIPKLARIVMLAPPNHGSPLADWLHDNFLFKLTLGPAGQELRTTADSIPNTLTNSLPYQIGIIAGNYSMLPFGSYFSNKPNDGIVAVASTRMHHMQDFIVMPVTHTFMIYNSKVIDQIIYFLDHGKFQQVSDTFCNFH